MIIEHVILQHLEEAAYSWLRRDGVVSFPGAANYRKKDLEELDDRVEASLDGLRIAVGDGWDLLGEDAEPGGPGEFFPVFALAFEGGNEAELGRCIEMLEETPEAVNELVAGVCWIGGEKAEVIGKQWVETGSDGLRLAGLEILAGLRKLGRELLLDGMADADAKVRARAFRAAGEMGVSEGLETGFEDSDQHVRFEAMWSALLLGNLQVLPWVQEAACDVGGVNRRRAVILAAKRRLPGDLGSLLEALRAGEGGGRLAMIAIGYHGDPVYMPEIIEAAGDDALSAVAGEAFSMMTGVDLLFEDHDRDLPEVDDDDEDDVDGSLDEDLDLPAVDGARLSEWWSLNMERFKVGKRYLCGLEIGDEAISEAFRSGFYRQIHAAVIEEGMRVQGRPLRSN